MRCVQSPHLSVLGRPIELYEFGSGPCAAMVFAGVHGDEARGVQVAHLLIDCLAELSDSAFSRLQAIVMPVANPDGYASSTRKNANGVDLNRNFPTKDYDTGQKDPAHKFYGGPAPASEPETKAILEAVRLYRPRLMISLHEPMGCVNYNGPSLRLARRISTVTGLPVVGDIGYPCPGSMGTYFGRERRIPLITLELPDSEIDASYWSNVLVEILLGYTSRATPSR